MATGEAASTVFGAIFHFVTWPLFFIGRFIADWWTTRNWSWFFMSVPALLVGGLVMVGFAQSRLSSDSGLAASYIKRAAKAFKAGEHSRAEMMYRKAIKYNPKDPGLKFARAVVLDQMDRSADAFQVMQSIAPLDAEKPGHRDAHLWIGRALLVQHVDVPNRLPLAESHLRAVLKQSPDHIEAHRMLANLAISVRNGNAAIEHISHIVTEYPETRIIYARLLDSANRKEEARTEADRSYRHYENSYYEKEARDGKMLSAAQWLNWASSAMILDKFNDAIRILRLADQRVEEKKLIRQGMAGVLVRWTQRLDEIDEPNIRDQLELLGEALRIAPDNPAVLERVALLIGRDDGADPIAEQMLQASLVNGTAPAIVHFLLGTRAAADGKASAKAQSHLEQALKKNPNTAVVLNNLAWVLASRGDDELGRALALVEQAVKLKPHQPNFHDTRGQIHVRMGNWRDGIADLEEALRKLKNNPPIHKALAQAYREIGNTEISDLHQKRYDELTAKPDESKPDAPKPGKAGQPAGK